MLDITIGNHPKYISLGELANFIDHGIMNKEYCSCNTPVIECEFWSHIYKEWSRIRTVSDQEYINLKSKFIRNKALFRLVLNYFFPSKEFKLFCKETKSIYQLISRHGLDKILVDSSKTPQMILILKCIKVPFTVVHLKRKFIGVLNSSRKEAKKDIEGGVERDFAPLKWSYVLLTWIVDNLWVVLMSVGVTKHAISYEEFVIAPVSALTPIIGNNTSFESLLLNRGPLVAPHLVAGNKLRMQKDIYMAKKPLNTINQLKRFEIRLAKIVDILF